MIWWKSTKHQIPRYLRSLKTESTSHSVNENPIIWFNGISLPEERQGRETGDDGGRRNFCRHSFGKRPYFVPMYGQVVDEGTRVILYS